jgi:uncharacterized membrane-anchored protein
MAWEFHVLVVANVTATSDELLAALRQRSERGACRFTLLMPREGPNSKERLDEALEAWRAAGLENVSGRTGVPDPIVATMEAWDPMEFDEIVVSTLPTGSSRWLGLDLPHRLEKLTSVPVLHVVSQPQAEVRWERAPERETYGVLSPLAAALGRKQD